MIITKTHKTNPRDNHKSNTNQKPKWQQTSKDIVSDMVLLPGVYDKDSPNILVVSDYIRAFPFAREQSSTIQSTTQANIP
jgi:hypothetical protein